MVKRRQKLSLPEQALLALAAALPGGEQYAPARLDALAEFAHFDDFARDIATQDVRHGELHAGNAGADEEVEMVQRAGANAHQDLVGLDASAPGTSS